MENKQTSVVHYDFKQLPRRAGRVFMYLTRSIVANVWARGQKIRVKFHRMEQLELPCLLLITHSSQLDFPVLFKAIKPHRINVLASHSGMRDAGEFWLKRLGCLFKRTGVRELNSLRQLRYCAEHYGDIVGIYPESHYSLDGTTDYLPESAAKIGRFLKLPVVTLRVNGTYLAQPQWSDHVRHTEIECEFTCIATKEEVTTLPPEEMMRRIKKGLSRDELAWQRDNHIVISDKNRAKGLHHILYRCPHCNTEFEMRSEETKIRCGHCGAEYEMTELGELSALNGETKFSHIPDWVAWERRCIREEVRSGEYRFEDEVEVHSLPHYKKFIPQGRGKFLHTKQGMILDCNLYGKHERIVWASKDLEQLHIEFDYPTYKRKRKDNRFGDCFELSVPDDSYWIIPQTKRNCVMKLFLATEEIHQMLAPKRLTKAK